MPQPLPTMEHRPVCFELGDEVLPLSAAAVSAYASVYQTGAAERVNATLLLERLDGLASAIGCIADLYAHDDAPPGLYRRVSEYEVHTGLFRSGGNQLCFRDGRPPIKHMFVTRAGLERVVSLLQGQGRRDGRETGGKAMAA